MDIRRVNPDDLETLHALTAVRHACSAVDTPWSYPWTEHDLEVVAHHGWDGEPPMLYAGKVDGRVVVSGELWLTARDNLHLAWAGVDVHPAQRRLGLGSQMLRHLMAEAAAAGRTSVGAVGWDEPGVRAFASAHGFEPKSVEVDRRQLVQKVDRDALRLELERSLATAAAYDLVRMKGPVPEALIEPFAEMVSAINDAPTGDLDIEDEVFDAERVRGYEKAVHLRGQRLYRVVARHRGTGDLAGNTTVVVGTERPFLGAQHDTSVVRAHRGHRLGVALKGSMLLWLAEEEPQLEILDTGNAESNAHMIAVNDLLGYEIMGRALEFQRDL